MEVISLKDFELQEVKHNEILNRVSEAYNPKLFLKEGFNLTPELEYSIDQLNESELNFLVESISQSNIEKAVYIMDHTNDEVMKEIRNSRGDVKGLAFYDTLQSMIDDVTRANISNKEILTAKEIIMELEKNKSVYTNAFRTDNIYRKAVYVSSIMAAAYTIVKEHLAHTDFTASKNEGQFVMKENVPGEYIDEANLKNLKSNLYLVRTKVIADEAKDKTVLKEGINDAAVHFLDGISGATNAAAFFGKVVNGVISGATTVMSHMGTVAMVVGVASVAMYGLYVISKVASVNIKSYIDSYRYIQDNKKTAEKNPSLLFRVFDKVFGFRRILYRIWANKDAKNIQEYMKELDKERNVISRYADKKPSEPVHSEPSGMHSQRLDNHFSNSFI